MTINMDRIRADAQKEKGQQAATSDPSNKKFNLVDYLSKYGVSVKAIKPEVSRTLYILEHCLFNESHTAKDAAIIEYDNGKLGYHCFHDSCSDKHWADARRIISGNDPLTDCKDNTTEVVEEGDWEPKIKQWPVMGKDAFYGLAGEFVELATRNSEADPVAVLLTFLTRFGIEAGDSAFVPVGDTKHPAREFTCIVGASSMSRKGTSAAPVDKLFDPLNSHNSLFSQKQIQKSPGPLSTGEGIIYAVRDPIEKYEINKKTKEGDWVIVDPGVEDKRLYVQDEEFASA